MGLLFTRRISPATVVDFPAQFLDQLFHAVDFQARAHDDQEVWIAPQDVEVQALRDQLARRVVLAIEDDVRSQHAHVGAQSPLALVQPLVDERLAMRAQGELASSETPRPVPVPGEGLEALGARQRVQVAVQLDHVQVFPVRAERGQRRLLAGHGEAHVLLEAVDVLRVAAQQLVPVLQVRNEPVGLGGPRQLHVRVQSFHELGENGDLEVVSKQRNVEHLPAGLDGPVLCGLLFHEVVQPIGRPEVGNPCVARDSCPGQARDLPRPTQLLADAAKKLVLDVQACDVS